MLSLGLDFKIPFFKPRFVEYFTYYERLMHTLKSLPNFDNCKFEDTRRRIQSIAHMYFRSSNNNKPSFFVLKPKDREVLNALGKDSSVVICKPDKGRGVVLLEKTAYVNKMEEILSDSSKFISIQDSPFKLIFQTEDKVNRSLRSLLDNSAINEETYKSLYSTGSGLCTLYGLPKIHKQNVPMRPILAAYNSPNAFLSDI